MRAAAEALPRYPSQVVYTLGGGDAPDRLNFIPFCLTDVRTAVFALDLDFHFVDALNK